MSQQQPSLPPSTSHLQPHADPRFQCSQDQLWKIIENQRVAIQNLQKENAILTSERDGLRDRINQLEQQLFAQEETNGSGSGAIAAHGPTLPPRSPYRATKPVMDEDHSSNIHRPSTPPLPPPPLPPPFSERRPSTPASPIAQHTSPQTPTSPQQIIEKDAQLYAQYQMSLQKREPQNQPLQQQQQQQPSPAPRHTTSTEDKRHEQQQNDITRPSELSQRNIDKVVIKVLGSNIKTNDKGREVVSFIISVGNQKGACTDPGAFEELWRVEKLYSDILALDAKIKSRGDHTIKGKISKLPEKQLFSSSRAPSKIDQRKIALEQYLQHIVSLPHIDITDICEFLTTNVFERDTTIERRGRKSGYLIKRGKNFGGWKSRYFVISGPVLEYYESKEGGYLGSIKLTNAQLGRQAPSASGADDIGVYRHAFLIIEQKRPGAANSPRHILCANSDEERDEWVDALLQNIRYEEAHQKQASSENPGFNGSNSSNNGNNSNNNNNNNNNTINVAATTATAQTMTKKSKKTDKSRKISKVEIRPVAATPISHMKMNPGAADMEKLTSAPAVNSLPLSPTYTELPTTMDISGTSPTEPIPIPSASERPPPMLSTSLPAPTSTQPFYPASSPPTPLQTQRPMSPVSSPHEDPAEEDHVRLRQNMISPTSWAMRSNDDLTDGQSPGRVKQKANRVTMWGKKMFSSSLASGSSEQAPSTVISGRPSLSTSTSSSEPTSSPPSSLSSSSRISSVPSGFRSLLSRGSSDTNTSDRQSDDLGSRQVFGVPLEEAVRVSRVVEGYELPSVVYRCIEYLDAKQAMFEEGLYRLSGSKTVIQKLKQKFNQDGDVNLLASREEYDVHAITSLLKLWLRELPTTVLTRDHRSDFLHVIDLVDRKDRVNELGRLMSAIPLANYTLLRALTAHLMQVVRHSEVNKMTMRNVSIIFAPTLGIPPTIFSLFMTEFEYIFWTTEDGDAAPRMMEDDDDNNRAPSEDTPEGEEKQQPSAQEQPQPQQQPSVPQAAGNTPQIIVQRKPTLRLREEFGRSNRNSVHYMDGVPNAIVSMEKQYNGGPPLMDEDEDDVDDLAMLKDNDAPSDEEDEPLQPYNVGLSPMPPRMPSSSTSSSASGLQDAK
ncbi:hypothetical protein BX666DRAFT_1879969 [Dichotomocladium elegans]|nr:hypothetical protein BX666DRAFT_1879969 [Dichotomocladium elegans]